MQQKKQDIVEEARAIIRNLEGSGTQQNRDRSGRGVLLALLYGGVGFGLATVLSLLLRVSLFR